MIRILLRFSRGFEFKGHFLELVQWPIGKAAVDGDINVPKIAHDNVTLGPGKCI